MANNNIHDAESKFRISELDSLRGFAALSVVIFHITQINSSGNYKFNVGCMGVDMFFIISGFVIFMTINNSNNPVKFIRNRFSRLFPAYWFVVTFTTLLIFLSTKSVYYQNEFYEPTNNLIVKYFANLTMFQYFFKISDIDGQYWTLVIELVFYFFILLLILIKKIRHTEFIGGFLLLCSSFYIMDFIYEDFFFHKLLMIIVLLKYFPLFYAGILLFKMKFEKITFLRMVLFLTTLVVQCLLFDNCYHNNTYLNVSTYSIGLTFIYLIFILFLFNKMKFIVTGFSKWLGKISYSLYLVHQYLGVLIFLFLSNIIKLNYYYALTFSLTIVIVFAHLINKFIEIPFANYLKEKNIQIAYNA